MSWPAVEWAWRQGERHDATGKTLLTSTALLVLVRLAWKATDDGVYDKSLAWIANDTLLTKRCVIDAVNRLRSAGLIETNGPSGRPKTIRLRINKLVVDDMAPEHTDEPRSSLPMKHVHRSPPTDERRSPLPMNDVHHTNTNQSKEATQRGFSSRQAATHFRANDPPQAWVGHGQLVRDDDGVDKPAVNGWFLHECARQVAEAAGLPDDWRGDWSAMIAWLQEGIDFDTHILPAIRQDAARSSYKPPDSSVRFFDKTVRHFISRRGKAA